MKDMGDKKVSWEEAKNIILENSVKLMGDTITQLKSDTVTYADIASHGGKRLIHNLVDAKWGISHPEDFIVSRVTDEEDYVKANAINAYKWYIAAMNGDFDPSDSLKLGVKSEWEWENEYQKTHPNIDRNELHEEWNNEFRVRLAYVVNDILTTPDIRLYVIQHFSI